MEAKELMIGDWVQNTHGNKGRFSAMIHFADNDTCEFVIKYGENATSYADSKLIMPIPLTPEILEKNGFKDYVEIKEYQFKENGERYRFYLKKMYKNGIFDCWGTNIGGVLPSLITSVHELQHALRLCGLNDLADNFNI